MHVLGNQCDVLADPDIGNRGGICAIDNDLAGGGILQARDQSSQSRLTSTRCTDQRGGGAGFEGDGDIRKHVRAAGVGIVQALNLYRGLGFYGGKLGIGDDVIVSNLAERNSAAQSS